MRNVLALRTQASLLEAKVRRVLVVEPAPVLLGNFLEGGMPARDWPVSRARARTRGSIRHTALRTMTAR
jgi:hypothetical protein